MFGLPAFPKLLQFWTFSEPLSRKLQPHLRKKQANRNTPFGKFHNSPSSPAEKRDPTMHRREVAYFIGLHFTFVSRITNQEHRMQRK
jgi:hypothetical protein